MKTYLLPRLLILCLPVLAMMGLAACNLVDDDNSSGGSSDERKVVDAPIDNIDILIRESAPPQYAAVITSGLPSGCAKFNEAKLTGRDGNTIRISVTNTLPEDDGTACTAIYGSYESTVELGSDFVPGETYTLDVNGTTKEFTAQ